MTARLGGRGFTLVEVLVALVLLTLLTVGVAGGVRAVGDTQARVQRLADRVEHMAAVHRWLMAAAAHPVRAVEDVSGAGMRRLRFQLAQDSLTWVGLMPPRPAMGGETEFRLAPEAHPEDPQRLQLVLRYRPRGDTSTDEATDWTQAAREVLVADLAYIRIEVQGRRPTNWPPAQPWQDDWRTDWPSEAVEFPRAIRLLIEDDRGPWPPLLVPIMPTLPSVEPLERAVIGGGSVRR
ncbi:prepilin-type N-terminal cleavage/methylation domain-containing protein [Tepidimonas taiwanensis]|uniref:Type II secretion system protein J n=2 Tax=Tepidimonas TaxID=114248 RepID=A0A554XE75_9BURK|nr:prepilin-type N-terminal cleavage/methylation domain-containing protein [Tepidimonas taiwanensis]TSE34064.1 hypothetical protein Ttaiw_00124 [Tepidimonas taiwanensis]UBQ04960.1 prepilin-type N-terminal cleavage/methylation domain-containing protein [Tepidimonas taiwanensis]